MPYKNREKQLAAQRAWNRKQTEQRRAERMRLEGRESTRPAASTASSPRRLGRLAATGIRQPTPSTERYWREREAGKNETEALAALRHDRARQQQEKQIAETDRRVTALAPQFIAAARRHLSQAGCYREEQVAELARHMAARSLVLGQPPRQGDRLEQLPPPRLPALPPPQPALPIWQGVRRPASVSRAALGGERRILPEEVRAAIHEAVAELARRESGESGGKL